MGRRPVISAVLPIVFVSALFILRPVDCLTARSGGRLLFAWPIRAGDFFEVTFIHSLNKSPVTDHIEYDGNELIVRKSVFKTFGGGIPVPSDGIGTELIKTDSGYELIGIDKRMPGFTVITQVYPDHRIAMGGREASLLSLAGSGAAVEISVKKIPFIVIFFKQ